MYSERGNEDVTFTMHTEIRHQVSSKLPPSPRANDIEVSFERYLAQLWQRRYDVWNTQIDRACKAEESSLNTVTARLWLLQPNSFSRITTRFWRKFLRSSQPAVTALSHAVKGILRNTKCTNVNNDSILSLGSGPGFFSSWNQRWNTGFCSIPRHI
jgi:hypothetical protein